ncbi:hypothetical protein [Sandaracinus amylolyticus]|uniref:Uncharacterized protein n=1 Tax=Sandaracinus amylolyticus TaxID=927083 RepID=A0A0F6W5J3_9BACT|nr:hypothetical protein [Sandaracinus amylolyticus]AKF07948.1 hypothetical protein DB32_005097 [Sandaracinus amylolyticus]UJR79443.1 Hypothetical protein I5071_14790 [Sandaracinus amylolyticus]
MERNDSQQQHDATIDMETREARERFEVKESAETLEVVELESAPLTDVNFGF